MPARTIRTKTIITILSLVIVVGVGGFWLYESSSSSRVPETAKESISDVVDRGLQPEDQARLQAEADALLAEITTAEAEGNRDLTKRLELGNRYYELGQLTLANEQYQNILSTNPQDTPSMQNMGQSLLEMGAYADAADIWVESLNLVADEAIYLKLVDLIDEHLPSRVAKIPEILETAIGNLGQTSALMKRLGIWYLDQKRYPEAISHLEIASKLDPSDEGITELLQQARKAYSDASVSNEKKIER